MTPEPRQQRAGLARIAAVVVGLVWTAVALPWPASLQGSLILAGCGYFIGITVYRRTHRRERLRLPMTAADGWRRMAVLVLSLFIVFGIGSSLWHHEWKFAAATVIFAAAGVLLAAIVSVREWNRWEATRPREFDARATAPHAANIDATADAIAAFEHLAWRGSIRLDDADRALLARPIRPGGIAWRGGIRPDASGGLTLIDAALSDELSPADAMRVGPLLAAAYLGFYDLAADGVALTDVTAIGDWYGTTMEENYPEAGAAFLRFATTYWTFKVLLRQLELQNAVPLVRAVLEHVDDLLAPLFFPFDGPITADPEARAAHQRQFLAAFGPRVDVEDFIARNPVLIRDRLRRRNDRAS